MTTAKGWGLCVPYADLTSISGMKLWLRADTIVANDGDLISTWKDESGSGNNATAAGSARPTYHTNKVNGLPSLTFDGVANVMATAASASINGTAFVVVKRTSASVNDEPFLAPSGTGGWCFRFNGTANNVIFNIHAAQNLKWAELSPDVSKFHIFAADRAPAGKNRIYLDGKPYGVGNESAAFTGGLTLRIGAANYYPQFAAVQISEVIFYDSVLSDTDRAKVHDYLLAKYALAPTTSTYADLCKADSAAHLFLLSEPSGTTMTDSGPKSVNGTYTNSPTLNVTGPGTVSPPKAATFTGSSSQRGAASGSTFYPTPTPRCAMSVEFWIKTTSTTDACIVNNGDEFLAYNSWNYAVRFTGATGKVVWHLPSGASDVTLTSDAAVNDGNWHHIVFTYDGTTMKMYKDGALQTTTTARGLAVVNTNAYGFDVATTYASGSGTYTLYFTGSLFGVADYADALTAAQVLAHYQKIP